MSTGSLSWVGLFCCLIALASKLFPDAAYRLGVDQNSVWLVFGFGVFLILTSAIAGAPNRNGDKQ